MATGFDLVGILLLVIMAVSGLKKGLIDGVLKIVGMYAAIYAAMHYNTYGTALIAPFINLPEAYKVPAGFVIMFIGTMYSITLVSWLLKKLVKSMHLGAIDKFGGFTLGALKAGLMLSAVVWAMSMVPADRRGTWQQESQLYPYVEVFAGQMVFVLSLEDEMAMLQTMMDPDADKTKLLQAVMGDQAGGMEAMLGGDDSSKTSAIKKALDKMGGSQGGIMNKVLKSAGLDAEEISNLDLMEEVDKVKHAGTNRQKDMDKLLEDIEKAAQASPE